jgi:hypothetical protein
MILDKTEALEKILTLCNNSRLYTRRTQEIHEIAMQGLGLTKNQRDLRHDRIYARTAEHSNKYKVRNA